MIEKSVGERRQKCEISCPGHASRMHGKQVGQLLIREHPRRMDEEFRETADFRQARGCERISLPFRCAAPSGVPGKTTRCRADV